MFLGENTKLNNLDVCLLSPYTTNTDALFQVVFEVEWGSSTKWQSTVEIYEAVRLTWVPKKPKNTAFIFMKVVMPLNDTVVTVVVLD